MSFKFENMSPQKKQWLMLGAGVIALITIVYLFADSGSGKTERRDDTVISNVLTDNNTREIGIDAMAARLDSVEQSLRDRERQLQQTETDLKRVKDSAGVGTDVAREVAKLKETVIRMSKQNDELRQEQETINRQIRDGEIGVPSIQGNGSVGMGAASGQGSPGVAGTSAAAGEPGSAEDYFRNAPVPTFGDSRNAGANSGQAGANQEGEPTQSRNLGFEDVAYEFEETTKSQADDEAQDEGGIYIPSGSLLTGTLLTGLDAPTGQGARRDPFPVVLRIQKEAILPNQFLADIRECMVIMSGYGDLSSERVYLRTEGISCVREDGKSIEARMEGYAVGEDGKAGMRGRLVTKQGQMIARSMTAGFMSGVAGAFDVNPVPVVQTNPQGNQPQYLDAFSDKSVQSGIVNGAGSALERIADFYLELANSTYPVLELDAGRQIDVVMVAGSKLQIQ